MALLKQRPIQVVTLLNRQVVNAGRLRRAALNR
jgi:hypothetical protein